MADAKQKRGHSCHVGADCERVKCLEFDASHLFRVRLIFSAMLCTNFCIFIADVFV